MKTKNVTFQKKEKKIGEKIAIISYALSLHGMNIQYIEHDTLCSKSLRINVSRYVYMYIPTHYTFNF